ncbi:LAFE_0F01244g1_1 [Lachancea fermentati]|uniref:LAFE_0F01244g1_1 n=1 Tax=Lachancea fermentati TaxID=4955 RepID=A0A1G4ME39_LACFM|nr:LAFE_0F01244g1_1 [Lachancea fermentati]
MGSAEYGTAKYLSKQLKAKGLQKLRFYCQVCQKQCRDENGFKSHSRSPSHMRKISQLTPQDVDKYTQEFEKDFLRLLRLSHGEKKVEANKFYNEFIQDRDHIHMNATKFRSLTNFIGHLSKTGKVRMYWPGDDNATNNDLDESRIVISYIDNSFESLQRKDKLAEVEKSNISEQVTRNKMLMKQIEKGREMDKEEKGDEESGCNDNEGSRITPLEVGKVSLKLKKPVSVKKVTKKKNVFKMK